jgi:chromosome segregation ATPase
MNVNGLRTQYPYSGGEALSPRPLYDFPSPTSNYPSGIGGASPSFYPMAYNISPRFGGSVFIPSADVFGERGKGDVQDGAMYTPREIRKRTSAALNSDPVAMHLLVETAIIDSQVFEVMSVEEVEALKQEQKGLDARLGAVRRRLESETKIRDAAQSLTRLNSKQNKGHQRGLGSRGSNATKNTSAKSEEELNASNKKVEDLTRELLEIESRMRLIDMQLLMHTAAVLQMTHNGPARRKQNQPLENGTDRRPDSPASIYTYEKDRSERPGEVGFDERSFYRSPENLDSLMTALQNGTHHQREQSLALGQQNQALASVSKRLDELNGRLREVLVQANPDRNEYSLPPSSGAPDASSVERQLDFLDQGLRDMDTGHTNRNNSMGSMHEVEERLEGINNQLYAMLSKFEDKALPPPPITSNGFDEQLNYMEDSFYNVQQLQYSLNEQIDEARSRPAGGEDVEKYETTLQGLWDIIQAGEEQARERKRERRRLLAESSDNEEELSPDEDHNIHETYSLPAFSAKIQYMFSRATSLKDKQAILLRQIKQQRELNSKSDAQKEAEFEKINERLLSARSVNKSMESELERAMSQLKQFDGQKAETEATALRNIETRNVDLERQLQDVQERSATYESQLKEVQQQSIAYENQLQDAEDRATGFEAQIRDAQQRASSLEAQLRDAQDDARVEAASIQAELSHSAAKIEEATAALVAATAAKEAAEARASEASTALSTKEEELRNLEGEVVRLTTELTFAKAELDGAYGTRAQRAAESGAKNADAEAQLEALQKISEAASKSEAEARESERNLKAELSGMAAEYEALTRDAIQNEKDRDALEASIDKLRDEKESLEMELSDERVKWLGIRSPSVAAGAAGTPGPNPDMGATSIRMLREDFRKMMRERTAEGLRALRVCFYSIPFTVDTGHLLMRGIERARRTPQTRGGNPPTAQGCAAAEIESVQDDDGLRDAMRTYKLNTHIIPSLLRRIYAIDVHAFGAPFIDLAGSLLLYPVLPDYFSVRLYFAVEYGRRRGIDV